MEATLKINGNNVQINDATLKAINVTLAGCPIMEEKHVDGQYVFVPNTGRCLQLETVFELKSKFVPLTK